MGPCNRIKNQAGCLNRMDALAYLTEKYKIDLSLPSPFSVPMSRETDIPQMFKGLGFKIGAEIGVYRGEYSETLLKAIPGLKLSGIDLWGLYPGYRDYRRHDIIDAEQEAREKTRGFDCQLYKGWSHEIVKQFADESLDFVYIDGNHAYEYTVQDIALWSKKVRKGGVIYGHDFEDWSKNWRRFDMGVINAVTGWCKSYQIHPWFIITKDKHPGWMYIKTK
ncbi:MAG: hypothetical protein UW44_C0008G0054 [Candidatus Collierbacteria bacterium GW2011_GWB2_44_22]|uniref:Class I SAM-dependent methyltransferase n=1 Tax=Candidatus Collierbacteria bacterium GW2011_GWB2_44_22 TaxID=1618387 RepID=A0A0G1K5Z6_9BACT|nr:MAG: hypothetical protein UW44_C0008G0054 [Candidatus Collierbacteria bacterium GW2011_GWB2_44_22]KKT66951.1 MAG: hypothetical protein UW58_C0001G0055 [Candidatus Collierbacteria bacterium GW2011_GWC2_44_30]